MESFPPHEIKSLSTFYSSKMEGGIVPHMQDATVLPTTLLEKDTELAPTLLQKVIAELVGTFMLVLVACGSLLVNQRHEIGIVGVALTVALDLTVMIYTLGHVSGGHLNPAVTVAFAAISQFPWKLVPIYLATQVAGATLASLVLRLLFHGDNLEAMLSLPSPSVDDFTAFSWEIIIAFILMWVACGTVIDNRAHHPFGGIMIGAAVFFNIIFAASFSGASMNPARSLGPAIATFKFKKVWIYITAPVIGGVAGATAYSILLPRYKSIKKKIAHQASNVSVVVPYPGKTMEFP